MSNILLTIKNLKPSIIKTEINTLKKAPDFEADLTAYLEVKKQINTLQQKLSSASSLSMPNRLRACTVSSQLFPDDIIPIFFLTGE